MDLDTLSSLPLLLQAAKLTSYLPISLLQIPAQPERGICTSPLRSSRTSLNEVPELWGGDTELATFPISLGLLSHGLNRFKAPAYQDLICLGNPSFLVPVER